MAKPSPGEILRAQLEHKRRTLPMFLRPQLGDVLGALDDWIAATETRLAGLDARVQRADKMPSAAALDLLTQGGGMESTANARGEVMAANPRRVPA